MCLCRMHFNFASFALSEAKEPKENKWHGVRVDNASTALSEKY